MERIEIQIARKFHKVYEKLAPEFGYTTRPETREFDENSSNGKLMIAVCKEVVLEELDRAREEGIRSCIRAFEKSTSQTDMIKRWEGLLGESIKLTTK
jgi:hypothetical protein